MCKTLTQSIRKRVSELIFPQVLEQKRETERELTATTDFHVQEEISEKVLPGLEGLLHERVVRDVAEGPLDVLGEELFAEALGHAVHDGPFAERRDPLLGLSRVFVARQLRHQQVRWRFSGNQVQARRRELLAHLVRQRIRVPVDQNRARGLPIRGLGEELPQPPVRGRVGRLPRRHGDGISSSRSIVEN